MVKRQSGLFATATAATLLVASLGLAASAQADTLRAAPEHGLLLLAEAEQSAERPIVHLSDEGLKAVRAISAARLAIFEGLPEEAEKFLKRAKADLGDAAKTADKLAVKPKKAQNGVLIPIDARLTLADDFILTPEKAAKITKVNEHLKKGESKQAIEILRDAGIALNLTTVLLPLESTTAAVDKAAKLVEEGKYYEANLALKAAEDGILVDSQGFAEWLEAMPAPTKKS